MDFSAFQLVTYCLHIIRTIKLMGKHGFKLRFEGFDARWP